MTSKKALSKIKYIDLYGRYPYPYYLKDDLEYKEAIDVLEQLVDRDTPKKPIKNTNHEITQHNCSVCLSKSDIPQLKEVNFCPKCGQRIMWAKENEK